MGWEAKLSSKRKGNKAMPMTFTVSREDMLRGKTVDPGWYKTIIRNVSQEPASTDGSTNTIIDLIITDDGPFKDVPLKRFFSEKAPGFAIPFLIACGAKVGEQGVTVNMEHCKGKTIMTYVGNGMYNNRPTNNAEDFRPVGGAEASSGAAELPSPKA